MGELKPINPTKAQIIANPQAAAHDYSTLSNKPQINGVVLEGDKNSEELGLQETITAAGYLSIAGGTLSFDDMTFMVKRDALPKIGIRDANQSGFTPISEDDVSEYTTGVIGQIPVATAGTFFRAYGGDVCTEMYQTVDWKLYVRAYKLVGEHWLGMFWREIGSEIASGTVNEDGTITFYDENGVELFTTTGASVIGAQGNSITSAEIINNNLIIHIGALQPDGTILDTPVNVGRVVGQNGAPGVSVTGATVNQQGHLILTLSDGTTIDAGYVGTPKTDIAGAVITLSESTYTYDGASKAPNVTSVTLNGQALTAGTDYAVVANPATNAGQYVVTVNGIGDYTGTATIEWTITKAQATITGDDSITISGLNEPVSKTYTTNGDGAFSFEITGNVATVTNTGGTVTITPTSYGTADLTVTVSEGQNYLGATKTVSVTVEEVQTQTVFGVVWDYSLLSPQLARLTPQTDPLGVVTTVPTQEPTACVGNDGNGQSDFDNYMPWAGMHRYNYVNGQIVDFVDYSNGETFVYIPEFWSKIVDDSETSKMYIYISDSELNGFTKHPGSGRYIARYPCDVNFLSRPNGLLKVNTNLGGFRSGITNIDNLHFQFDIHTYMARNLLYLVECANYNSQAMIGEGITGDSSAHVSGETDILTYHTGRVGGTNNQSAVQYRWIENLWGYVWNWIDGVLIQDGLVYICNDAPKYSSTITENYISTELTTPTNSGWHKTDNSYNNCYLIPATTGGSDSTYTCDNYYYDTGLRGLRVGGAYGRGSLAGLFCWAGHYVPDRDDSNIGGRSILILGGDL